MVPRDGIEPPTRGFSIYVSASKSSQENMGALRFMVAISDS